MIILIIPLTGLGYYFYTTMFNSMEKIGQERGITSVHIAQSLIDNNGKNLLSITNSNSHWEDYRKAIENNDLEWIKVNVDENLASVTTLDFIVTTDTTGKIISSAEKVDQITQDLNYPIILDRLDEQEEFYGLINTAKGLAFIAVSKVTSEDGQEPSTGNLIFGSLLDEETFLYMEETLQVSLGIMNNENQLFSSSNKITAENIESYIQVRADSVISYETELQDNTIFVKASTQLKDVGNQSIGVLYLEYPLKTSTKVIENLEKMSMYASIIIIILIVILLFVLQRRLLAPLEHFKKALEEVASGTPIKEIPSTITAHADTNIISLFDYLHKLSYHDYLTDLPNRRFSYNYINHSVEKAQQKQTKVAVLYIDLDRFKNVNDSLGHSMGDQLLKIVAARLLNVVGDKGIVSRLGGDEFAIILNEIKDVNEVTIIAESLIATFKEPFIIGDYDLFVTSSIGISMFPHDGHTVKELYMNADVAMYRAKEQGRNKYQYYRSDMNSTLVDKLKLESDLRKALEKNEMFLTYQPKINIDTNEIIGMEALIRWLHPELGIIAPNDFIPIAEETGLIISLGEWVLKTACRQNKLWQDQGMPNLKVAVNISARQFQHNDIVETVTKVLEETKLDPKYLELEITESTVMNYAEETIKTLNELKDMGVSVSIDDFGTGYSSLSYLKLFPIKSLKIDRSFIKDIEKDHGDLAIAKSVITLGHALNFEVVAEGVENKDHFDILKREKCDVSQGYYYSPPVTAEIFENLLKGKKQVERV